MKRWGTFSRLNKTFIPRLIVFGFFTPYSYLIEAFVEILVDVGHGHGEPPTIYANVVVPLTVTVSPGFNPLIPLSSTIVKVIVVPVGRPGAEIHILQKTSSLPVRPLQFAGGEFGFVSESFVMPGVTTAVLAPCLTAFLREFFVYQARANSDMPNRMSNNKKSIRAVSTNVCPFCSLTISILAIKSGPRKGRIKRH